MNKVLTKSCASWATRLAARHPSDLSVEQAAALSAHLKTCPACASVHAAYTLMETSLRQLPPVAPLTQLPIEQLTENIPATKQSSTSEPIVLSNRASAARARQSRPVRMVNLLAAVLIVCVLIAGSLVLFSLQRQTGKTGSSQFSCQAEKNLDPTVLTQLCQHNLLTDINQSQTVGGYTITLQKAYVDANELIFEYTTHRSSTGQWVPSFPKTLSIALQTSSGPIALGDPGDTSFSAMIATNAYPNLPNVISVQNTGEFPQNLQVFNLQIMMKVTSNTFPMPPDASPAATAPTSPAPLTASFSFPLKFHAGQTIDEQQIINGTNVNQQTVTVNGVSLALFKTIVSPSMVALYVRMPARSDTFGSYSLFFNGNKIEASGTAHGPSALPTNQSPYYVFSIFTSQVFNQHGNLTLTIDSVNGQSGPWTFIVNLP